MSDPGATFSRLFAHRAHCWLDYVQDDMIMDKHALFANHATTSIHMTWYGFDNTVVVSAMRAAVPRGLEVQVVVDEEDRAEERI